MSLKYRLQNIFVSTFAVRAYLVVGILAFFFITVNYFIMPWIVNHGGIIKVPEVEGMTFDRAKFFLDSLGFDARKGDVRTDPRREAGIVVMQNPPAGDAVKFGRRIYLTVSGGEPVVTVPDLKGRSQRDARFLLMRNGLNLGEINFEISKEYPENTVIKQSVEAGDGVRKGAYIRVVLSLGDGTGKVEVPDLNGKTTHEAEKLLAQRGLKIGNISYQVNPDLPSNTILSQFPHPGIPVTMGQTVDLFVVQPGGKKLKEIQE